MPEEGLEPSWNYTFCWILSPARYVVLYHIKYSLICYNLDSLLPLINEESGENVL